MTSSSAPAVVALGAPLPWGARTDIQVVRVSGAKEHCVLTSAGAVLCTPPVLGRFNIDPDQLVEVNLGPFLSPVASVTVTGSAGVFAGVPSSPLSERALAACVTFQDPADGLRCFGSRFFGVASDTQGSGYTPGTDGDQLPTYAAGVKSQSCFDSVERVGVFAPPRTLGTCLATAQYGNAAGNNCEISFTVEARLPAGSTFKIFVDDAEVISLLSGFFPETRFNPKFTQGSVRVELVVGDSPEDLYDPSCDCYRLAFVKSYSPGASCTSAPPDAPIEIFRKKAAARTALQQQQFGLLPDGPMLPVSINFWCGDDPQELVDLPALALAGFGSSAPIDSLAVGRHSCAVAAGKLFCWGDRSYRAAGPTDVPWHLALEIDLGPLLSPVAEVAIAGLATCVRLLDSTVRCFGTESSRSGQLGGTTSEENSAVAAEGVAPPLAPLDLSATVITSLSLNTFHTCAIINGGIVKCVGAHTTGLGSAVAPSYSGYLARSVAAGAQQTCILTEPSGRLVCFHNTLASPPSMVELPRAVVWTRVLVSGQSSSLSASYDLTFTLGLDASQGKLYTWGADIVGLVANVRRSYPGTLAGQKMSTEASLPPKISLFRGSSGARDLSPLLNPDGTPVAHVCAAEAYFCVALRGAQFVRCVGFLPWTTMREGDRVASGPSPWDVSPEPEFLAMANRGNIKLLSCGEYTVCMVFDDDSAVCHFNPRMQMFMHSGYFKELGSMTEVLAVRDLQVGSKLICFLVEGRGQEVRCASFDAAVDSADYSTVALSVPNFLSENRGGLIQILEWHSSPAFRVSYSMALVSYMSSDAFAPINLGYAKPIRSIHSAAAAQRLCVVFVEGTAVCMGDNARGALASTAPAGVYSLTQNSMGPSIPRVRMAECQVGFEPASLGACAPCKPGHFGAASGSRVCVMCGAGTFSAAVGARDQAACQLCPPGTYSGPGAAKCAPCAPGTFAPASGADACTPARPGYHVSSPRAHEEVPCGPGFYASASGSSECTRVLSAERREYTPEQGAPAPLVCPDNSRSTGTACTCQRGFWLSSSSSCVACPAGRFGAVEGATSEAAGCLPCAAGTASLAAGRDTPCPVCPAGTSSSPGASSCSPCPPGSFAASPGAATCQPCEVGTRNPDVGASSCLPCLPGTFSASAGSTTCAPCPSGTYAPS
jgi:hypothetical protein